VPFDLLDNVLLLDLTLEAAKGVFKCFALLQFYFSQMKLHLPTGPKFPALRREGTDIIKWLADKVKYQSNGRLPAQPPVCTKTAVFSAP
jgi:hypothetical protein